MGHGRYGCEGRLAVHSRGSSGLVQIYIAIVSCGPKSGSGPAHGCSVLCTSTSFFQQDVFDRKATPTILWVSPREGRSPHRCIKTSHRILGSIYTMFHKTTFLETNVTVLHSVSDPKQSIPRSCSVSWQDVHSLGFQKQKDPAACPVTCSATSRYQLQVIDVM
jgi:hypothetical protein